MWPSRLLLFGRLPGQCYRANKTDRSYSTVLGKILGPVRLQTRLQNFYADVVARWATRCHHSQRD